MERTKMERKLYTAGAVKFSFWFMEFRKTVQLLSEGKSFADIKKLNEETNIYGAPTKLRAQQIYSMCEITILEATICQESLLTASFIKQ